MRKSKTRFGKNWNNTLAYINEYKENVGKNYRKDKKSYLKTLDNLYGHGDLAANQKASSNYYKRKSEYSKTRLGKTLNESRAYNMSQYQKANERTHGSKNVKEYGKNLVNAILKTEEKSWAGRKRTSGGKIADDLLTGGTIGLVKDIHYYKDHKKKRNK